MDRKRTAKGFLAFFLTAVLLVGCSTPVARPVEKNSPAPAKTLTLILAGRDEFLITLETAVKDAAEAAGYTLHSQNAALDSAKQLQYVEEARKNGEKVVIVNLVYPNTAADILKAAGDMKVVFLNRQPSDMSVLSDNAIYVGSDEAVSGKMQGQFLSNYFRSLGKTDIRYLLLEGIPGLTTTTIRTQSVLQALKDGGLNATQAYPPLVANFARVEAMTLLGPLLRSGIEFDTVISNNDAMALGAIEAMEQQGMDPSRTPIVGIDATAAGLQAVKEGKLAMTVFQNAEAQGSTAVTAALNLLEGKPITESTGYPLAPDNPHVILIPFEPVTKENVADFE